jgi:hypothetical protein
MHILMMHRTEKKWEDGAKPGPELVQGMGRLIGQMIDAGVFVDGQGLRSSALGVRLNFQNGKRTITPGPFTPGNELPAGFAIVRVSSLEEVIGWASRFASIVGDVEIDLRPINERWDIGVEPRPEGLTTTRYMLMHKADAASESGTLAPPGLFEKMAALIDEMTAAGVFVSGVGLAPSAQAKRAYYKGGQRRVVDGPFTESKELIAGYCLIDVESVEAALPWADRFAACIGDVELDLRPLHGAPEAAPNPKA